MYCAVGAAHYVCHPRESHDNNRVSGASLSVCVCVCFYLSLSTFARQRKNKANTVITSRIQSGDASSRYEEVILHDVITREILLPANIARAHDRTALSVPAIVIFADSVIATLRRRLCKKQMFAVESICRVITRLAK